MEGMIKKHLADPWLGENVEMVAVPRVGYDGMAEHIDYISKEFIR